MKTQVIPRDKAQKLVDSIAAARRATMGISILILTPEACRSTFIFDQLTEMRADLETGWEAGFRALLATGWDMHETSPGHFSAVDPGGGLHQSLEYNGTVGEGALPEEKTSKAHQKPVTRNKKPVTGKPKA